MEPKGRLTALDIARGLAALSVVFFHANGYVWQNYAAIWDGNLAQFLQEASGLRVVTQILFGFGFLGVPLFFVLSGFVIHLPNVGKDEIDYRKFFLRRFFRIYPVYFAVVFLAFLEQCFYVGFGNPPATFPNLIAHWFFWYYALPSNGDLGVTGVLWTIALEIQFYLLYVIFFSLFRKVGFGRMVLLLLGIDVLYRIFWYQYWPLLGIGYPEFVSPSRLSITRFGEWLLGAWLAETYARSIADGDPQRQQNWVWLCVLGLAIVLCGTFLIIMLGMSQSWNDITASLGFALLIWGLAFVQLSNRTGLHGHSSIFRSIGLWLGNRSYSLYLIHLVAIYTIGAIFLRVLKVGGGERIAGSLQMFVITLFGIAGAMVLAEILFRVIERPSHGFARGLAARIDKK